MARVTVFGGAGVVGSICVRTLARSGVFSEIIVADADMARADKLVRELNEKQRIKAVKVDANDPGSLRAAMDGSSVVVNCIGPFYRFAPPVLAAACESRVNYVDICDDYDATEVLLGMDSKAREVGILALIGMGSSPGLANVLIRFCTDYLLDPGCTESIDIYHAHGGEPEEGRAVVAHRIHSMLTEIPVYLDGEYRKVKLFEESGRALEGEVFLPEVGKCAVYPYPHPETITLPRYVKGVKRVTNLGTVLPQSYAELIKAMVKLGIVENEPIDVNGTPVSPREFTISYVLEQRRRLLDEEGLKEPVGCLRLVVSGTQDGKKVTYAINLSSRGRGMGDATGIPAAMGAILMQRGKLRGSGALPPEACVDPMDVFDLAREVLAPEKMAGLPVTIEKMTEEGQVLQVFSLTEAVEMSRAQKGK